MNPILYSTVTEGTVPSDYGIGVLSDCLSCKVKEVRNSEYELTMEYASEGIHAESIVPNAYLKVKPNYTDNPQLFRIYKVGKTINGRFEVNAQHISYDLSGKVILYGTANNAVSACSLLTASAGNFTISTTKSVSADFEITEPSSVKSWFGGKEGSLLDVYGGGEWQYDNFTATLKSARGADRGVTIRYGKNLTELSQEIDMSNLVSGIVPYCRFENGVTYGTEVSTGLVGFNKTIAVDFTDKVNPENNIPTQLASLASAYISSHNLVTPLNNITLDFVQLQGLTERVDLCDTVHIYFEPLGISASMKCISTTWDCLKERYIETEFGDAKQSIVDTLNDNSNAIATAMGDISSITNIVNGKSRVFASVPVPPYSENDLWVDNGTVYMCIVARDADYVTFLGATTTAIYDGDTTDTTIVIDGNSHTAVTGDVATYGGESFVWNGSSWVAYEGYIRSDWDLATDYVDSSDLEDSIARATTILTGGIGGNVMLNYRDKTIDGVVVRVPYEILILCDADTIDTATEIWRWNASGLGYSKNGYAGPYETAITIDENGNGQINANFITTGVLNAQLVTIQNLTATSFQGNEIILGGSEDCKLEVHDTSNPPKTLIRINGSGMECFGEAVGGVVPSVVFDKNGVTGYSDSTDRTSKIFWTHADQFHMKNGVVENELSVGGMLRFVPVTVGSFEGVVIVPVV